MDYEYSTLLESYWLLAEGVLSLYSSTHGNTVSCRSHSSRIRCVDAPSERQNEFERNDIARTHSLIRNLHSQHVTMSRNFKDYRQKAPAPIATGRARPKRMDNDYDYGASAEQKSVARKEPPSPQLSAPRRNSARGGKANLTPIDVRSPKNAGLSDPPRINPNLLDDEADEALLDSEQLEELHSEAERMKALGNKHMAAQVRCFTPMHPIVFLISS